MRGQAPAFVPYRFRTQPWLSGRQRNETKTLATSKCTKNVKWQRAFRVVYICMPGPLVAEDVHCIKYTSCPASYWFILCHTRDTRAHSLVRPRPLAILLGFLLPSLLHTLHSSLFSIPSPPIHQRLRHDRSQLFVRIDSSRLGITHDFARA